MRTLLAWKRGEPRVCSMVCVPTPEEEDRRRVCRELKTLIGECIRHVNRLKGLSFAQGIDGYEPRNRDRRERLEDLLPGMVRPFRNTSKRWPCASWKSLSCCTSRSRPLRRSVMHSWRRFRPPVPHRNRFGCCSNSRALAAVLPAPCGPKACSGNSRTDVRSQRMPVLRPHRGRVARSITNRVSQRHAILVCVPSPWKWPGFGCGINRSQRLRDGITGGPPARPAHQESHDRRIGEETTRCVVEVRDQRRCDRRRQDEDLLTADPETRNPFHRSLISSGGSGGRTGVGFGLTCRS